MGNRRTATAFVRSASALLLTALIATVLTIVASASFGATPAEAQQNTSQPALRVCVTNVSSWDTLNLRTGPGTNYPIRTEMPHNTCSLLQNGAISPNGWMPIEYRDPSGTTYGWASLRFLRPFDLPVPPPFPYPAPPIPLPGTPVQFCVQAPSTLNLRSGPSTSYAVKAQVRSGDCTITPLGPSNGPWMQVRWNGRYGSPTGWMHSSYLRPNIGYPGPIVYPQPPFPVPPFPLPVPTPTPPTAPLPAPFPLGPPICVSGISYGDSLNVRSGPALHHRVLTSLPPGACANIADAWPPTSGWTRIVVQRPNGRSIVGYAASNFLAPQQIPW